MAVGLEQLPLTRQSSNSLNTDSTWNAAAFWLLGLINNSAYVIMIAGANEISAGSVGLVYLAAIVPCLFLKLSVPYWFHAVGYEMRIWAAAVLMSASYVTVAMSSSRPWQLLGVAFGSLQVGLGEASCLALCALYEPRRALTCWSSGTGFAGVFGYAWVTILHLWSGLAFSSVLFAANASSIAWLWVYYGVLQRPPQSSAGGHHRLCEAPPSAAAFSPDPEAAALLPHRTVAASAREPARADGSGGHARDAPAGSAAAAAAGGGAAVHDRQHGGSSPVPGRAVGSGSLPAVAAALSLSSSESEGSEGNKALKPHQMSWQRRLTVTLGLYHYIGPLVIVYAAEYAMQAGTWAAIGFPISDAYARHRFYEYANWCYQVGVFLSRSSGLLYQADRKSLWAMPALQCGLLAFFSIVAALHWPLYNMGLLLPAFVVGLLGGLVYVNTFTLIAKEVDSSIQEFALAATSVGESVGTLIADVSGVLIQGCMFRKNGLPGADFKCGA